MATSTPASTGTESKPIVWPVLTGYAVVLGGTLLGTIALTTLIVIVWSLQFELTPDQVTERLRVSPAFMVFAGLLPPLLLVVVSKFVCAHERVSLSKGLQMGKTRAAYGEIVLLGVATIAAGWAIANGMTLVLGQEPVTSKAIRESVQAASGLWKAALLVTIVIIAPITEEAFFRGCLQPRLRARWGALRAVVVTSILFGIMHFHPVHMIMAAVIGVGLGWTADRAGGIRPALAIHASNNAIALLPALLGWKGNTSRVHCLVTILISTVVAAVAVWMVRRIYPLRAPTAG